MIEQHLFLGTKKPEAYFPHLVVTKISVLLKSDLMIKLGVINFQVNE